MILRNHPKREKILSRFKRFAPIRERGGCWEWQGAVMSSGYGDFSYGHKKGPYHFRTGAHRFAWMFKNGREVPLGMDVCHRCDNKKCVNPKHLFVGSRSDNMQDAKKKGRLCVGDAMRAAQKGKMPTGKDHYVNRLGRERNELGQFIGYGS